jgi:hypothetical protein
MRWLPVERSKRRIAPQRMPIHGKLASIQAGETGEDREAVNSWRLTNKA